MIGSASGFKERTFDWVFDWGDLSAHLQYPIKYSVMQLVSNLRLYVLSSCSSFFLSFFLFSFIRLHDLLWPILLLQLICVVRCPLFLARYRFFFAEYITRPHGIYERSFFLSSWQHHNYVFRQRVTRHKTTLACANLADCLHDQCDLE